MTFPRIPVTALLILLASPAPAAAQAADDPRAAAGSLSEIGVMSSARAAHTMTTLADGSVLILGGMATLPQPTASAQLFDPRRNRFVDLAVAATPRKSHTATRLRDGRVLITGGFGADNSYLRTAELYDPVTRVFSAAGPMREARTGHEAVLLDDGRVLLVGGTGTGWSFLSTAEIYDPETRTFAATGSMTEPRESHVAVKLRDGRVLVVAGHRGRRADITISRTAEIFDPATGRFSPTGALNVRRHKHDALLLPDGRVLVLGGADERDDRGVYTSTEVYDPATGRFENAAPMRLGRYKLAGTSRVVPGGRVLIASGAAQAELYDPASGRSTLVPGDARMAGQFAATAPLPDGRVLITGGYGEGTGPRTTAWVFTP